MLHDGFTGVLGTGGGEAAGGRREGGDELLVKEDGQQQEPFQQPTEIMPEEMQGVRDLE